MSRRAVVLHPDAAEEARAAFRWYAQRDRDAARRFMAALDRAIDLISEAPERWPPYIYGTHRLAMRRFPFAVVYRVSSDRIVVIAIAHQSRRPGYWSTR